MHQVIHGRGPGGPVPISIQGQSAGRPGLGAEDPRRSRAGRRPGLPQLRPADRSLPPCARRAPSLDAAASLSSLLITSATPGIPAGNPSAKPGKAPGSEAVWASGLQVRGAGRRGAGARPARETQVRSAEAAPLQGTGSQSRSSAPAPPRALPVARPSGPYIAAGAGAGRAERAKGAGRGRTASREMEFCLKAPDAGKDCRREEKGTTEDKMVGWHHRLNGHEFERAPGVGDGQGGLACCSPWGRKESDTTERLN